MLKSIREQFAKDSEVMLGDKVVQVEKITPKKYRSLIGVINTLPNLLIQVSKAPRADFIPWLLNATEIGLDEIIEIVAELSGVSAAYLEDNAGIDEITEYLTRMYKHNDLSRLAKNVKSLLPTPEEASTEK